MLTHLSKIVAVTEMCYLALFDGQNPEIPGSPAAKALENATITLSKQPGYLRSF